MRSLCIALLSGLACLAPYRALAAEVVITGSVQGAGGPLRDVSVTIREANGPRSISTKTAPNGTFKAKLDTAAKSLLVDATLEGYRPRPPASVVVSQQQADLGTLTLRPWVELSKPTLVKQPSGGLLLDVNARNESDDDLILERVLIKTNIGIDRTCGTQTAPVRFLVTDILRVTHTESANKKELLLRGEVSGQNIDGTETDDRVFDAEIRYARCGGGTMSLRLTAPVLIPAKSKRLLKVVLPSVIRTQGKTTAEKKQLTLALCESAAPSPRSCDDLRVGLTLNDRVVSMSEQAPARVRLLPP
jgi:hypothetical protein